MAEIKVSLFKRNKTREARSAIERGVSSMFSFAKAAALRVRPGLASPFAGLSPERTAYRGVDEGTRLMGTAMEALETRRRGRGVRSEKERALTTEKSGVTARFRTIMDTQTRIGPSPSPLIAPGASGSPGFPGAGSLSAGYDDYEPGPYSSKTLVLDSYKNGTEYVPRTGLYQLHQGEKVTPAAQNNSSTSSSASSVSITFSPGAIVINGANKSTDQLAAELAKPLKKEFEKLLIKAGA